MAKRRNLKKEKALRNQAYARKFRKRSGGGRYGRRFYNNDNRADNAGDQDQDAQDAGTGAAE